MIVRLHRRYGGRRFLGAALAASGVGFWLAWFGPHWFFETSTLETSLGTALGGMVLVGILAGWVARRRSPGELAIAQHLDRSLPGLEESTELLLADVGSLSALGRRQRQLIEARLNALPERDLLPWRPVWRGAAVGGAVWLTGFLGLAWGALGEYEKVPTGRVATSEPEREAVLVEAHYRVELPAYTGRDPIVGPGLGLEVVRGSTVVWEFRVAGPVDRLLLEGPVGEEIASETASGIWTWSLAAIQDRPLRLVADADGERLPLTDWELVSVGPDLPPKVTIVIPERIVEIDEEAIAPIDLQVLVTDDFGLDASTLVATLAQGTGENVEFRERRLRLPRGLGSATSRTIDTQLDLRALGLAAGSELVFHVETRDGRRPEFQVGRSASRIVRVRGGSEGTVGLGRGLPILTPPEVFRSQRQILLDTEALVADRTKLTPEEFRRRAETIGFDQRALRMRYGILLGEENVPTASLAIASGSGQGAEASDAHDAEEHGDEPGRAEEPTETPALVAGIPGDLAHRHDSAEMATFFPDPVRSGLRRALAAMWEAERRLRAVEPSGALPFERTALEELQNLKRATRVYVDRVGFDAPALDEDRRLGGELEEIDPRRPRRGQRDEEDPIVRVYQRMEAADLEAETLLALMRSVVEGLGSDLIGAERLRWLTLKSDLQPHVESGSPVPAPLRDRLRGALWSWADTPAPRPSRRVTNEAPFDAAPSPSSPQAGEADSPADPEAGPGASSRANSGAIP